MTVRIERWNDNRIAADVPWSHGGKDAAKRIAGASAVWDKTGPRDKFRFWSYPLTINICRRFREEFGDELEIGPKLREWAWDERRAQEAMEQLRAGEQGDLPNVRSAAPTLWDALQNRPFQITGTSFIVKGKRVCLGDEPRLGKTYQAIAAAVESGVHSILIACPRTATRSVWANKIRELLDESAFVAQGERADRELVIEQFHGSTGRRFLVINREMIRIARRYQCPDGAEYRVRPGLKGGCKANHQHKTVEYPEYPGLFRNPFDMIIIDESHNVLASSKHQISANIPQIRLGAMRLPLAENGLKLAMSGTPFRDKNIKAWGTANWLRPDEFSSFWRFAEEHYGVTETGYRGARVIGATLKSETAFQDMLRPFYLARTKIEVAPYLKPIEYAGTYPPGKPDGPVGVYLDLEAEQLKAYREMEDMGLATLADGKRITANGVLAEIMRLKQFACSTGKWKQDQFFPAAPSCKLDWILDFLEEREDQTGKVVIASQFTKLVEFIEQAIRAKGWEVVTITGKSTDKQRDHAQDVFQHGTPRVAIINMFAGGEAIDLSAADEMIITDEPWQTSVIQQVENRIQNLAKQQQLTIYRLRGAGTIEQDIASMTDDQRSKLAAGQPQALESLVDVIKSRKEK